MALSCVLLVWGGVFLQRLAAGQTADLGFRVDGLAFVETDARFAGCTADEAAALQETLLDRIAALPGIESATRAVGPPVGLARNSSEPVIDGSAPTGGEVTRVGWAWAGPGYFETLQIPLLYGRTFTQFDRPETPDVAVINEGMARRYFGRLNAVGGRFRVAEASDTAEGASAAAGFEVIGVVPDIRTSVFEESRPLFYRSSRQAAASTSTMLVRTALDPGSLLQQMQQTVRDLDSQVPVLSARTMTQYVDDELGGPRQVGAALGGLGALGLGLASLGLYAVMAFAVSRRTREIGIRRALGAQWTQVIWTVSRGVATPLGVGVTTGLAFSWLSVKGSAALSSSLSQGGGVSVFVPTVDLRTFVLVTVLMAAVGLAAAFFPARRAARADPLVALRQL